MEPYLAPTADFFDKPRPTYPPPVYIDSDIFKIQSFKIERILNKRIIKKGYNKATEYFIRWKEYSPEHDKYYNIKDLNNANKLVDDYKKIVTSFRYYSSVKKTAVIIGKPKINFRQKKSKITKINNIKKKTQRKEISTLKLEFLY